MKIYLKTILVVIVVSTLNFALVQCHWSVKDQNILEIFFALFGVLYAIIMGFAIYVVLNDYNEIRRYIHAEVNELQDLRDYLMWVDNQEDVVKEIKEKIKGYIRFIVGHDWPVMEKGSKIDPDDMDTPVEVYELMKSVNKIKPTNESDVSALNRLIETIASLNNYRTDRLISSQEKLPPLIKHIIVMLSLFLMLTFTLIPVESFRVNMLLNSLNTFGIALIYFVIEDLDYPFGGVWVISSDPYQKLLQRLH